MTSLISGRRLLLAAWISLFVAFGLVVSSVGHSEPPPDLSLDQMKQRMWETRSLELSPETAVAPPEPASAPEAERDWERLVLQYVEANNFELLVMNSLGFADRRLTYTSYNETKPKLSSDGTHIVYVADEHGNQDLFKMAVDTGVRLQLTTSPGADTDPAWSPDDLRIAFASDRGGNFDIYLRHLYAQSEDSLTNDPHHDVMPAWSPDGRYLVWVRMGDDGYGTLWRHDFASGEQRAITGAIRFLQNPDWSPDGAWLAIDCDCDGDALNELAIMRPNNPQPQIILDLSTGGNLVDSWLGGWSPDSRLLYHTAVTYRLDGSQLRISGAQIKVSNLHGSETNLHWRYLTLRPHVRPLDSLPPALSIEPFPQYWRTLTGNVTLNVVGDDIGPSGVDYFVVLWTDSEGRSGNFYRRPATDRVLTMSVVPGRSYEFEVWARDHAGNRSALIPARNPLVPYAWAGSGRVLDQRGYPVVDAWMRLAPDPPIVAARSDLDGWYRTLSSHKSRAGNWVWATRSGYGAAPAREARDPSNSDTTGLRLTMSPPVNYIANGGFEQALDDWSALGAVGVASKPFAGRSSVLLGSGGSAPGARHVITQSVSIPSGAYEPTLSFEYQLEKTSQGQGGTVELLLDGATRWQRSANSGPDWQHVWVDLEGYQGQTVELVFRLTEPSVGSALVWLDDIMLGEWRTPVVATIDGTVTPGQSSPITIRGENFDPAGEVLLDGTPLPGVQWVDVQTLTVTIPAQPPGFYELLVRNRGGQLGGLMLPIGAPTFIPQIAR